MFGRIALSLGMILWCVSVAVAEPPAEVCTLRSAFWCGVRMLNITFKFIGSLSGGADRGAVWQYDLATGVRSRIAADEGFAWPVRGSNGRVFALRDGALVTLAGADVAKPGVAIVWRKLIGVDEYGAVLGLVRQAQGPVPGLLSAEGVLAPVDVAGDERAQVLALLQEDRAYTDDRALLVTRSERGGRGFDVYYVAGATRRNVSDCGDDACGQPALSADGRYVLYVRASGAG
jgi:hypothetical protein